MTIALVFFGPAINLGGKVGIGPGMGLIMKDWQIQNDTLIIEMGMPPGYVVVGPDGKEAKNSDKPSYAKYIVREVSDSVIVLEDLISEFPGTTQHLKRSEKLELLSK
jgi:hypothetical protein